MNLRLILPISNLSETDDLDTLVYKLKNSPTKKIAFFDEHITGYIILENDTESIFFDDIQKVYSLNLDFSIVPNNVTDSQDYSNHIKNVIINGERNLVNSGFNEFDGIYYLIWKFDLPIRYPKNKYVSPKISLTVSLSIDNTTENRKSAGLEIEGRLANFIPIQERNILAELDYQISGSGSPCKDLALSKTQYIPYSRINQGEEHNKDSTVNVVDGSPSKVVESEPIISNGDLTDDGNIETQATTINDSTGIINLQSSTSLPVYTVLLIRLKSTKPAGRNNILLSTLDIECSSETIKRRLSLEIQKIDIKFQSGTNDDGLIKGFFPHNMEFPIDISSNDSINITYKIMNDDTQQIKPIVIKIHSKVKKFDRDTNTYEYLGNGSIITNWSTNIDFGIIAPPINNSMKTQPSSSSRTSSKQYSSSNVQKLGFGDNYQYSPTLSATPIKQSTTITNKKLRSTSSSLTVNVPRSSNSILGGLVLTFKGKTNFKLGEVVKWNIQAINNSGKSLNLSLLSHSHQNLHSGFEKNYPKLPTNEESENNSLIVSNVNQIYKRYNSQKLQPIGIVCLSNDIKIGPLESKMVFETELRLMALSKGIFSLDGLKIIDVNTGEGFDCGRLLEVAVVDDE